MLSLRAEKMVDALIPISTGWLLAGCMEAKGRQSLWTGQKPEVLEALRERAMIQSVESSNRIEGVTVPADRLRPIILGKSRPRDRSEEEILGYRKALRWIFSRKKPVAMDSSVILHLHRLAQGGLSGDAGKWKTRDNEIIEILPNGERRIRFRPTPSKMTPRTVSRLCLAYRELSEEESVPLLLMISTFVFDFLCIHPFRDGNGRVSRLLTTLLLHQSGFVVGRYVSLERLIEEGKEEYYDILERCSQGWREGKNDFAPWWNYFLSILKRAYEEFARQVEDSYSRSGKSELVRHAIESRVGPFTLAEIKSLCPTVSAQLIKKILGQMKKSGKVSLAGRGRGALWEKTDSS